MTSRVHSSVNTVNSHSCGLVRRWRSALNHCLSWSKFVNNHLSHSRQWFNIHIHNRTRSDQTEIGLVYVNASRPRWANFFASWNIPVESDRIRSVDVRCKENSRTRLRTIPDLIFRGIVGCYIIHVAYS